MQYAVNNTPLTCCFMHIQCLDPTAESVEKFRNFRFINDDTKIANLAEELPAYLTAADGVTVTCEEDKLLRGRPMHLPYCIVIQPISSASAESAFSILANAFKAQQDRTLEDYL